MRLAGRSGFAVALLLAWLAPARPAADALLCSPSMLVGRLTSGATTPVRVVAQCGCTDSVRGSIRALGMPLPGGCGAASAAHADVRRAPAPRQAEASTSAPQATGDPRDLPPRGAAMPPPRPPPPASGPVCCDLSVRRDGVELLHERACDRRCTSRSTPRVEFP